MLIFKTPTQGTLVSNVFIEKYMPACKSAIFSVIYIYALKYALSGEELSNDMIADKLGILESDVIKAWEYWAEQGVIKLSFVEKDCLIEFLILSETTLVPEATTTLESRALLPAKPNYSVKDMENILQGSPDTHIFINSLEKIYAKPFSSADINTILGFIHWLGLSQEVILALFEQCCDKPMRYIEKTACDWADNGIKTYEDAEAYINTYYSKYREVLSYFGISGRAPIDAEKTHINNWLYTLEMPMELIKIACERTVSKTGKASFDYANSILTDWHKNKVKTTAQLEAYDEAYKQKKVNKIHITNSAKPQQKPTKFVNYNQPTYSDEEINAAIMRKKMRNKNE